MDSERGVRILEIREGPKPSEFLQASDLILSFNNEQVNSIDELL
jgi:hypothetical protein